MKRGNNLGNGPYPAILVIDDEQSICDFFVDLFDEYGVSIDTETSGTTGLKRSLAHSYSLVFLDVKLGDINGIEVLKQIKQKNPATRVVMISGYLTESVIEKALELGADGYLYKPISVRDLLSVILKFVDLAKFRKNGKDL
jgi:DNA-binding response OmpR family regulator